MNLFISTHKNISQQDFTKLMNQISQIPNITLINNKEDFNKIYSRSDILLFFPGDIDTLTELFIAITKNKNASKKIILYNYNYYFTPLIKALYQMYEQKMISKIPADYMEIESEINNIINIIKKES